MTAPLPASTPLPQFKRDLLTACDTSGALTFGTYTLKSGRTSPYFFNAGVFHSGRHLRTLTTAYAHTLSSATSQDSSTEPLQFDVLFGPAYKGIPLAAATVDKLADVDAARFGDVSYAFNRKTAKTYGDGGTIVGSPLKGKRVVIIDDVMTAGTAVAEAVDIIKAQGGTLVGIVVAFDRMEKIPQQDDPGDEKPGPSTIGEVRRRYNVPVMAVITLEDVLEALKALGNEEDLKRMEDYRRKYGATD